jgi:hypothetical protein
LRKKLTGWPVQPARVDFSRGETEPPVAGVFLSSGPEQRLIVPESGGF